MMKEERGEARGFTVIEVLVSLSLFAIISLAVYSAFAGGISAWRKTQEFSSVYQTGRLLLESIAGELRNTVKLKGTEFVGEPKRLSFVTALPVSGVVGGDSTMGGISIVTYELGRSLSSVGSALYRRKESNLKKRGEPVPVADPIESLIFAYTYKDANGEIQPWSGKWNMKNEIPYGIKIDLSIEGVHFAKWIMIPHGLREKAKN